MRYHTAIEVFGSARPIANALGLSVQSVHKWKKTGVVPFRSALRLQTISKRKAKIDANCYEKGAGGNGA